MKFYRSIADPLLAANPIRHHPSTGHCVSHQTAAINPYRDRWITRDRIPGRQPQHGERGINDYRHTAINTLVALTIDA